MRIDNNAGCGVASCPVDLGPNCKSFIPHCSLSFIFLILNKPLTHFYLLGPSQLAGPFDSTGFPLGCKSACFANLDGDPRTFCHLVSFLYSNQSAHICVDFFQRTLLTAVQVNTTPLRHAHRPALSSIPTSRTTAQIVMRTLTMRAVVLQYGTVQLRPTQTTRSRSALENKLVVIWLRHFQVYASR